jgi:hypothetical protein
MSHSPTPDASDDPHAHDAMHSADEPHGAGDHGETHGHDDHGHMDVPLGPVDWFAWSAGAIGVLVALAMWWVLAIATSGPHGLVG